MRILLTVLAVLMLIPSPALAANDIDRKANYQDYPYYSNADLESIESCLGSGTAELEGHKLPATKGGVGLEESINASGQVPSTGGRVTFHQFASLGQEYRDYYITMRWRYVKWNWNGTSVSPGPETVNWYAAKPRRVLVTNPRTKKSIIAAILESGPGPWTGVDTAPNNDPKQGWTNPQDGTPREYKGRVSGLPPKAFEAIGATMRMADGSGDDLIYSWAPDQDAKPGPVRTPSNVSGAADCDEVGDADILQYRPRLPTTGRIKPTAIVLHWWGGNAPEGQGVRFLINALRGNASCGSAGCSVQLGILKDGKTYQLTNSLTSRALHAVCANDYAIGIEIEGGPSDFGAQGPTRRPEQFQAVVATTKYLMERFDIPLEGVVKSPASNGAEGVHSHEEIDRNCPSGSGKTDVDDAYLRKVKDALRS